MAKRYDVLKIIFHSRQWYEIGSAIDLSDTDAMALLDAKAITNGVDIPENNPERNSDSNLYNFGESIPLFRMVYEQDDGQVYLANSSEEEQCRSVLGISIAQEDGQVRVKYDGKVSNPSWNFTRGKALFLHNGGQIKQTVPSSGHILQLGEVIDKNSINLAIKEVEVRS